MLNLFKLPFRVRQQSRDKSLLSSDFTASLMANLLRHRKDISGEELDRACNFAMEEMHSLQDKFQGTQAPSDRYEMMAALLRRIDNDLPAC